MNQPHLRPIICGTDFSEPAEHAANVAAALAKRLGTHLLICIGSHGHSGLLAAAMGSVAQAVIARSTRPVLVVRPPSS